MRYLLNSAVITAPGVYRYRRVTPDEAREWLAQGEYVSTIGYEQTSAAFEQLLGYPAPVNRTTIVMQPGDEALVFRIVLPPGTPRLDPKDKGMVQFVVGKNYWELGILERLE